MRELDIDRLDKLRKEKRELQTFLDGNGHFGIRYKEFTLTKFFGCGTHEITPNKLVKEEIVKTLRDRLTEIQEEIDNL